MIARWFRIGWLAFCIGILTGELEVAQAQVLTGEYGRQFIIDDGFAFEQYEERRALQEQFAFAPAASAVLEADSMALVTLYNGTNGADWRENTNWLTGPVANWFGVTVEGNRVVSLDLRANMLTGDLPNAITDLTALRFLDLSVNFYQGLIPLTIDALQDVEHLALGSSFLGGTIPVEIINLSNLRYLRLYGQELGGVILAELSSLSNLEYLEIRGDSLIGEIPSTLGNLSQLEYLIISGVNLTGEIPASLSNLSSLKELQIYNTSITGAIPAALEALEDLTVLRLDFNILEGSIPLWLTNLSSLETLNLASNRFTGTIPPALAELTNLKHLLVGNNTIPLPPDPPPAGNLLTGSIPPELGNLTNLEILDLGGNQLEGTIPPELDDLSNLTAVSLAGNQLEGSIPAALALVPTRFASFEYNRLSDVPLLPSFRPLHINNNRLTFEDIEPNIGGGTMYYAPQALIGEVTSEDVATGEDLTLHIPVGGASNIYQWYHDGVSISGANADTYTIANATADDAGVYTLEVTNTVATALTLESHPITVTVVGGPSNVGPEVTITDGPTGTQAPGEMTFVWSGSDPDGTIVGYEWALVGPETASASTTSMSVTLDVQGEGAYTFRVRAEDDDGAFSDWSERTFSVDLTNILPEITITEGPTGSVGAGAIVFAWEGSDPDGSIVAYEWELAGPQYAEGTTTSNTLTLEALPEGAYLFRIRAEDDAGAFSDWIERSFTVNPASAPQAQADAATTPEDTALPAIDVLGNDTDPDGTALSVISVSNPQHGTAAINANSTISYTPDANFHGTDTFVYTVANGDGMTAQGTVTITVTPVNDAPVFTSTPDEITAEGQVYAYTVTTTDVDGDVLTLEAVTLPAWLALTDNTNTSALLTGTPMQADVGTHEVVLTITDGTKTIEQAFVLTVTDVNIPPPPATLTALTDGSSMTLEGDPEAVFVVTWTASVDPDGDPLTYRWELAMENTFASLLFSEDVGAATRFETTVGTIGALLKQEGVEINTSITLFHRVVTSDGVNDIASDPAQITLTRGTITDTESSAGLPEQFTLLGNYPNPFNPETTIRVDMPEAAQVTVVLYDVLGREARRVEAGALAAGTEQTIRISAGDLSSGVYIYRVIGRLASGEVKTATGRMTLLK